MSTLRAPNRRSRRLVLIGLSLGLLFSTGTCASLSQQAVINGFFGAVNPLIIAAAEDHLGLDSTQTTGGTTTQP